MTPAFVSARTTYWLYCSGLLLLTASLPLSKFTMSIGQFMIAGGWLLHGNFFTKCRIFFRNKTALLLAGVYVMHLVGLIYTSDYAYAFKDLRIKLPLLILPFIFLTGPVLEKPHFRLLMKVLVAAVVASTLISFMVYLGIIHREIKDIRDITLFVSHIRLALMCCLSICVAGWLALTDSSNMRVRNMVWFTVISAWLVNFLVLIESLTGIVILGVLAFVISVFASYKYGGKIARIVTVLVVVAVPVLLVGYFYRVNQDFTLQENIANPKMKTASGNLYEHFPEKEEIENGYAVWMYLCDPELEQGWNLRSNINYRGHDARDQELRMTLIRFLTSKGLKKDKEGVASLSDEEIRLVEHGIANVKYAKQGDMKARVHQVLWEFHHYQRTANPSGHSATQRIEYWKAAMGIIHKHPLFGVGTGDIKNAYDQQYAEMNSKLSEQWRLRAHNQYLSIAVAFGICGLLYFLVSLVVPLVGGWKASNSLYISFSIISIISFLTEDTLETQAGVTFFALFTGLFLFVNPSFRETGVNSGSDG